MKESFGVFSLISSVCSLLRHISTSKAFPIFKKHTKRRISKEIYFYFQSVYITFLLLVSVCWFFRPKDHRMIFLSTSRRYLLSDSEAVKIATQTGNTFMVQVVP